MKKYRVLENGLGVPEGLEVYILPEETIFKEALEVKTEEQLENENEYGYFIYPKFLEEIK